MDKHFLKCPYATIRGYHVVFKSSLKKFKGKFKKKRGFKKKRLPQKSKSQINGIGPEKEPLSRCLLCLHRFHRDELEKHLWKCQAKMPCLNKIVEVKTAYPDESPPHQNARKIRAESPFMPDFTRKLRTKGSGITESPAESPESAQFDVFGEIQNGKMLFTCTVCEIQFGFKHNFMNMLKEVMMMHIPARTKR